MAPRSGHTKKIHEAYFRIREYASQTPLIECPYLEAELGIRIIFKVEVLQNSGSFKVRGAANQILMSATRVRGLIAPSSGNHACATARIGYTEGLPVIALMPKNAPSKKIERARSEGAEIVYYDRWNQERFCVAREIANLNGFKIIESSNSLDAVYGQATVGLEIFQEACARKLRIDVVVVPCCGGGLAAGLALAAQEWAPGATVCLVEPRGHNKMHRSLVADEIQEDNSPCDVHLCDALMARTPSPIPFNILRTTNNVVGIPVHEKRVIQAMHMLYTHLGLMPEPSAAAALAGVLERQRYLRGRTVVVVLTGGNISHTDFMRISGVPAHSQNLRHRSIHS
jgi:threonine dehydratase